MIQAALGGLLCFAACGDPDATSTGGVGGESSGRTVARPGGSTGVGTTSVGSGGEGGAETSVGGGSSTGAGSTSGSGDGGASASSTSASATATSASASSSDASVSSSSGATNPHTPIPDTACEDGQVPDPVVTSSEVVVLTEEDFRGICSEAGGIFEIQPLCGGSNACRGIAYDSATHVLTEHTCQATNTCAGYNCVVCDA